MAFVKTLQSGVTAKRKGLDNINGGRAHERSRGHLVFLFKYWFKGGGGGKVAFMECDLETRGVG